MPTYDYKCDACGHLFEIFQSMTDDPVKECVKCGGKVHRLISAGAGLIFKGSGFYATDYRSEAYRNDAKSDKTADAPKKTENGAPKKTESETQKVGKNS